MEIVESAMASALIVAIQLGMPVSILFIIGYLAYRSEGRDRAGQLGSGIDEFAVSSLRADTRVAVPCWEKLRCPPERRLSCPAHERPDLACWQAMKESLGRLQSECLNCERFVAPPGGEREKGERRRGSWD